MCLSCGCNHPTVRHRPGDIVESDLKKAADNEGVSLLKAARNIVETVRTCGLDGKNPPTGKGKNGRNG